MSLSAVELPEPENFAFALNTLLCDMAKQSDEYREAILTAQLGLLEKCALAIENLTESDTNSGKFHSYKKQLK